MSPETLQLLYILSGILIFIGLIGTVLPVVPGIPLAFAGMLLAAWAGDFKEISLVTVIALGILTAASVAVDFFASLIGAKRAGASKMAMLGGALGGLIGFLVLNIVGLIIGPFIGVVAVEMFRGKTAREAGKIGLGTWIGMAVGMALKVGLAFTMLGIFLFALWY
jgi:uncharacterized protein YqgC (DUF456 family)